LVQKEYSDVLEYSTSWFVPSYAPEGNYKNTLKGWTKDDKVAFCVVGEFAF